MSKLDIAPKEEDLKIEIEISSVTGALTWRVNRNGIPVMEVRNILLSLCDQLFMKEIHAYGEARYMHRIGGMKKKGIIQ